MSQTLTIHCPQCGKQARVGPSAVGKRGRCGKCSHSFLIQLPAMASEPIDAGDGLMQLESGYDLAPLELPPQPMPRPAMLAAPTTATAVSLANPPGQALPGKRAIGDGHRSGGKTAWIIGLAVGGAGLLVCTLILIVVVWVLMRPKGPPAVAGNGAAGKGAGVANAQDAAGSAESGITREPKAGSQFWIPAHPLAAADPARWKVTAEVTAPASGLHSVFLFEHDYSPALLFAAPQTAQAATVQITKDPTQPESSGLYRLEWTRLDLRTGQTLGKLPTSLVTSEPGWRYLCALGPSGKQLAIAFAYAPGQMEIWSDDGSKVATIAVAAVTDEARPRRVHFASESRVLVDVAGNVTAYDLLAGTEAFQIQAGFTIPPVLSLGGKWLAGNTGDGIAWYSTADGSPAGKIEFGEHWQLGPGGFNGQERLDWGLAFHPSGKSVAVLAIGKTSPQTLVAHYDLATGRVLDQFVLPDGQYNFQVANWCSDRQLHLSTGHVVDLDLKTWLGRLGDPEHLPLHFSSNSPDQRCWRLLYPSLGQKIDPRLGLAEEVQHALVASTVPDAELKRRRAEAQDSLIWGPGFAVALGTEVINDERRPQVLAALADMLAERGFKVDPAARHRLLVKEARALSVPDINNPGKYGYVAELKLELVDSRGQTISFPGRGGQIGVTGQGGYDECWAALCEKIKSLEPLQTMWLQPDGMLIDPHHARLLAIDGIEPKKE